MRQKWEILLPSPSIGFNSVSQSVYNFAIHPDQNPNSTAIILSLLLIEFDFNSIHKDDKIETRGNNYS